MFVKALTLLSLFLYCKGTLLKPKFEYKYSFKGPHLVQSDSTIPFWDHGGDAIANDDGIRLAPSIRSKKGWVWAKNPTHFDQWSVECVFKIAGRGRLGADGLGVWFTEGRTVDGGVFGGPDVWKGLGVFMDSFDNDGQHNNPYIMAVLNDGTQQFDHQNDGQSQQIGGCLRDFRNKPYAVRLKIEYYNKILTVFLNNGLTNNKDDFELCLRQENVELPASGYFGITAATGGLADDHDVVAFLTHSLHSQEQQPDKQVPEQDKQKYEQEFDNYYQELEKAKQDYQKQHPDKHPDEIQSMFEAQEDRELRMIFDGQTDIHKTLKDLNRKLDELLGRQEMVLSRVSQMSGGQVQAPPAQGGTGGHVPMLDTIQRHEVDRVLNNQNEIMMSARDIRNIVSDVQQRSNLIHASLPQGGGGGGGDQGGGIPPKTLKIIHELHENVKGVRVDVNHLVKKPQAGGSADCPQVQGCVSPSIFFVAIFVQLLVIIGYMIYRQNKEAQAKKFY